MKKYLGIDLGGTNIALGIVDEAGHILARCSVPTGAARPAAEIIASMADAAKAVMREAYRPHVPESRRTKLTLAKLGGGAGIIGAALLGMEK